MTKNYKISFINPKKAFRGGCVIALLPCTIQLVVSLLAVPALGLQILLTNFLFVILSIPLYGLIVLIVAAFYNKLSPYIGQFELTLEAVEDSKE